jgi:hypothetical protein
MNPYLRAAQKREELRLAAAAALAKINDPEPEPEPQPEPEPEPTVEVVDVAVIKRARDAQGQFIPDDPATADVDEAWVEVEP